MRQKLSPEEKSKRARERRRRYQQTENFKAYQRAYRAKKRGETVAMYFEGHCIEMSREELEQFSRIAKSSSAPWRAFGDHIRGGDFDYSPQEETAETATIVKDDAVYEYRGGGFYGASSALRFAAQHNNKKGTNANETDSETDNA